jgi:hypothetical protein
VVIDRARNVGIISFQAAKMAHGRSFPHGKPFLHVKSHEVMHCQAFFVTRINHSLLHYKGFRGSIRLLDHPHFLVDFKNITCKNETLYKEERLKK